MKRVLFVITQSEFGGAQRFLYELATRLDKNKYEILVASETKEKGKFLNSLEEKGIKTKKLKFLKRKINPIFDSLGMFEIMKLINNFKPDYLHLSSSKAGMLGSVAGFTIKNLKFKKFKDLKVIYRIGGWSFNDPLPWWKRKIFLWSEKMTAGLKDVIVVNNKSDFEKTVRLKIKPKKEIKLIHNGIDPLKIDFLPKDEARMKLSKNISTPLIKVMEQTDFIIGTVANFYKTKGLEYLIGAFKILKNNFCLNLENTKFLIIGDGAERKNLESLIKNSGLNDEIILAGQIRNAFNYFKAFDIFILPSVKEGFPWVILEAMAAKIPIIATSVGALPEIIENGTNGILVEPKKPEQIAEAIRPLLENERARQEMALQAHQTVLFKFPIEKMVRETEQLFN